MKKMDIRTRFTKQTLKDSLIEMMKEKSILDITIKEICYESGVSRSTFYTYYDDQYDLLQSIEDETSAYFESAVFTVMAKKLSKREIAAKFEEVFQYIETNSNSVQVLLSENGDIGFQKKLFRRFIELGQQAITRNSEKKLDESKKECYSVFAVHGFIALIHHWLKSGMKIPKNELSRMIVELLSPIF